LIAWPEKWLYFVQYLNKIATMVNIQIYNEKSWVVHFWYFPYVEKWNKVIFSNVIFDIKTSHIPNFISEIPFEFILVSQNDSTWPRVLNPLKLDNKSFRNLNPPLKWITNSVREIVSLDNLHLSWAKVHLNVWFNAWAHIFIRSRKDSEKNDWNVTNII